MWDVNVPSVDAFLTMSLGWRGVMGLGPIVWTGIDLAGLDALVRRRGLGDDAFEDVVAMVEAALPILNEGD